MYCKKCGAVIPEGSRFCEKCGNRVGENPNTYNNVNTNTNHYATYKKGINNGNTVVYAKLAFLISSVLAIISTFLPYIKVSAFGFSTSTNFIRMSGELAERAKYLDGIILIILAIVAIFLWTRDLKMGMLIVGAISSIFMIYEIIKMSKMLDEIGIVARAGFGFYLCCISSFIMFASSLIYYRNTQKY